MNEEEPLTCEQALAQIFDFLDHELAEHERTALERHLHVCKSCFSRAEFERRLKQKLTGLREAATPEARARLEKLIRSL